MLWEGTVITEEKIATIDGSVVLITRVGSDSVADGNGGTQLFTVSNATLEFLDFGLHNGKSREGDADLTGGNGGSVWIGGSESAVSWSGTCTFSINKATHGGAIAIEEGARAS